MKTLLLTLTIFLFLYLFGIAVYYWIDFCVNIEGIKGTMVFFSPIFIFISWIIAMDIKD